MPIIDQAQITSIAMAFTAPAPVIKDFFNGKPPVAGCNYVITVKRITDDGGKESVEMNFAPADECGKKP